MFFLFPTHQLSLASNLYEYREAQQIEAVLWFARRDLFLGYTFENKFHAFLYNDNIYIILPIFSLPIEQ